MRPGAAAASFVRYRILPGGRTSRVGELLVIGEGVVGESLGGRRKNLAFQNLLRANMVKLATGQQIVRFLRSKGVTLTKLTNAQIRTGNGGASLAALNTTQRNAVLVNTPLWFYIVREAEFNAGKLGGVGTRIVAETFQRAMQGSKFSIVRDPAFRPTLGPNNTTFRIVDLLFFAFQGNAALLNPN